LSTTSSTGTISDNDIGQDQLAIAESLLAAGAVQFGEFTLTSGRKSSYYVNMKAALAEPRLLKLVALALRARLPPQAGCLAGMELGAVPIAVAVALEAQLPYAMVRKAKRTHGTGSRVEGALSQEVVIVEDVATSGGSLIETLDVLESLEADVLACFVVVDREEGAAEVLSKRGHTLQALLTISQINAVKDGLTEQKVPTRGS